MWHTLIGEREKVSVDISFLTNIFFPVVIVTIDECAFFISDGD